MFLIKDWELFYTNSKTDEDLVDQISIDVKNKRYTLDLNADSNVTDGYDEEMNEIYSNYVSRFIFDLILESLKQKGFIELKQIF